MVSGGRVCLFGGLNLFLAYGQSIQVTLVFTRVNARCPCSLIFRAALQHWRSIGELVQSEEGNFVVILSYISDFLSCRHPTGI